MPGNLGLRLRQAREQAGLSQKALADRTSTTQQAINKIEGGETKMPRRDLLMRLCEELEIAPTWLLTGLEGLEDLDQESVNLLRKWVALPDDEKQAIKTMIESAAKRVEKSK